MNDEKKKRFDEIFEFKFENKKKNQKKKKGLNQSS